MYTVLMIVVALLIFGAVIMIHELGHFIAAKKAGIKVNEFAIGMGPALFKFRRGDTQYALRLLPIGGYVSMEGEDEESTDERGFQQAPLYKRIIVIIAGALMNMVLGFLALVVLVAFGGDIASKTVSQVRSDTAGLRVGDTFVKINGRHCFIMDDLSYEFARTQNGTFDIVVRRDGENVELKNVAFDTKIAYDETTGEVIMNEATGEPYEYLDVGFAVQPIKRGLFSVPYQALMNTLSYGRLIYLTLFDLVTGHVPINQLSGPVGIVSEIGKAVLLGWRPVVRMLALISVNLGIMNMLPLPALDGGKTLLLLIEGIRRKPIKQKYEIAINLAGFALLMCLMVFVSFNDIRRLFF